ncbi:hypothetical protein K505DRAFT_386159 [Melanomma pulvis-pyrius CBS 109.77]|uniref:Uncharacterized protein n=1 Tax=Melanomma pulvis-pyrius CBS 109.77 TaxID=1314802 RepID=A0A6A6X9Y5_9PLEO|nr:hypothetical protein K505DRAFT_386159 [Melanomma pulvis-pyrius CBS 109.77]
MAVKTVWVVVIRQMACLPDWKMGSVEVKRERKFSQRSTEDARPPSASSSRERVLPALSRTPVASVVPLLQAGLQALCALLSTLPLRTIRPHYGAMAPTQVPTPQRRQSSSRFLPSPGYTDFVSSPGHARSGQSIEATMLEAMPSRKRPLHGRAFPRRADSAAATRWPCVVPALREHKTVSERYQLKRLSWPHRDSCSKQQPLRRTAREAGRKQPRPALSKRANHTRVAATTAYTLQHRVMMVKQGAMGAFQACCSRCLSVARVDCPRAALVTQRRTRNAALEGGRMQSKGERNAWARSGDDEVTGLAGVAGFAGLRQPSRRGPGGACRNRQGTGRATPTAPVPGHSLRQRPGCVPRHRRPRPVSAPNTASSRLSLSTPSRPPPRHVLIYNFVSHPARSFLARPRSSASVLPLPRPLPYLIPPAAAHSSRYAATTALLLPLPNEATTTRPNPHHPPSRHLLHSPSPLRAPLYLARRPPSVHAGLCIDVIQRKAHCWPSSDILTTALAPVLPSML